MSFVNSYPNEFHYNIQYKIWMIDFPIDIDCMNIIKKLLYSVSISRSFNPPMPDVFNLNAIEYDNHFIYINPMGIVFSSSKLQLGNYYATRITTKTDFRTDNTLDINNIKILEFSYSPGCLHINYEKSKINNITLNTNEFINQRLDGPYYESITRQTVTLIAN